MASKRRRHFGGKFAIGVVALLLTLGGIGYGLFYTSWLQVEAVEFEGVSDHYRGQITEIIEKDMSRSILGIPVGKNILWLDSSELQGQISRLDFLSSLRINKDYPHTLKVVGSEREEEGVWCFNSITPAECKYFDSEGHIWGKAAQSSGSLFLNVDDMREASSNSVSIDKRFFEGIKTAKSALDEKNIKIKRVVIPAESLDEFQVQVSEGYPLKFSIDSNITGQVSVYEIFMVQKLLSDKTFKPQYIDLRFDGRVYFK